MLLLDRAFEIVARGHRATVGAWDLTSRTGPGPAGVARGRPGEPWGPAHDHERVRFATLDEARRFALVAARRKPSELRRVLLSIVAPGVVSRLDERELCEIVAARALAGEIQVFQARVRRRAHDLSAYEPPEPADLTPLESEQVSIGATADVDAADIAPAVEAEALPEPLVPGASADEVWRLPEPELGDAEDQAVALREAAQAGAPFCEECARARAKAAREAAGAPPEDEAAAMDPARQAEALREAAKAGDAVCEECEKAAAEGADVASEPATEATMDAAAQADTMKSAAAQGAPFCEECEKAKRARAQA